MIPVVELLYGIDQRLNKLSTSEHQFIPDEDKLLKLNEAQLILIKRKVDGNNIYKLGLDGFKKRYHDLQGLIEPFEKHPLTLTLADSRLNKWITPIPDNCLFYIDAYLLASEGACTDRIIYCNATLAKHTDITLLLRNSNYTPSFDYQETLVSFSSDLLEIYTDGEWINGNLYLSYLRYPKPMSIAGLEDMNGNPTSHQDCELEYYLKDELLDIVVLQLALNTENDPAVQGSQLSIQNNE